MEEKMKEREEEHARLQEELRIQREALQKEMEEQKLKQQEEMEREKIRLQDELERQKVSPFSKQQDILCPPCTVCKNKQKYYLII